MVPAVRSSYEAPRWLRGGHAQTIWPLCVRTPSPVYARRRWVTPDGDFIDLDFTPERPERPLIVLFHGLEGSSESPYARALMHAVWNRGLQGVVVHFRGCSGEPNRLPRAYHSGDAEEIEWILERLASLYPTATRHAVGISLGANALLCWLGTRKRRAAELISRAASISAPLDLAASGHHLGRGFNRIYTRRFLRTLRRKIQAKAAAFPTAFDSHQAIRARTLFEFDNAFTAPVHGYRNAQDYWDRASSKPHLPHIVVPTLVLNAKNDPFLPAEFLPTSADASAAITLEQPAEGGHVGFVVGPFPGRLDWLPTRILAHLEVP